MLREKMAAFTRYNAWEKSHRPDETADLPSRLAWLEEAYALAEAFGAIRPLPPGSPAWRQKVSGVRLLHERLALLGERRG